jgi:mRNA deadenylase 3'-5' endonuclease subunit Ccr4
MVNTLLYVAFILVTHLRCVPSRKMWIPWVKGQCINLQATDVTVMTFNLLCDILILILPQSTIWKLNLRKKQKIGLSILFSLGLL